jgi:hypothetical protein
MRRHRASFELATPSWALSLHRKISIAASIVTIPRDAGLLKSKLSNSEQNSVYYSSSDDWHESTFEGTPG